jgi:hypothetical protein
MNQAAHCALHKLYPRMTRYQDARQHMTVSGVSHVARDQNGLLVNGFDCIMVRTGVIEGTPA